MVNLDLIEKHNLKPPFFIYDESIIKGQFSKLKRTLPQNFKIFYSVKSNPNIHTLKIFKKLGVNVEISSGGELKIVLRAGFLPAQIIFTGPGKTIGELEYAIKKKIHLIIVESINEIRKIEQIVPKSYQQNILIRINPSFPVRSDSSLVPIRGIHKFGIDEEKIFKIVNQIKGIQNPNLLGIHSYIGSNIYDVGLILKNAEHLFKITDLIEKKFGIDLPIVDIGGGLAVDYLGGSKFDLKELGRRLGLLVRKYKIDNKRIILELGRFLVSEAGEYVAEVVDKKNSREKEFVLIDGGKQHISAGAGILRNGHPVGLLTKRGPGRKETVNIVGNLNASIDFITKTNLPKVEIGDLLVIKNTGAYGLTAAMPLFSSHPIPKEYLLLENGTIESIGRGIKYQ